ncbi:ABC transporter ATP-binding protein [Paenibacillus qinlingensis]|uniref:iron ABC transporter ATP-binding protein n=1 Tax=Paenibacillus qinlingensis TaxID=1837343 RepID=UPI001567A0B3|nr:ATP-binding cassette domain-containing protein [Paenibacillus qinlingensis]NQX63475.1 ATP-binding cassette domain-containing protein [Paenibacillus qinlingensis]
MIQVTNLTKQYTHNHGIHQVTTTIAKGQITSLIGPNGAGKSTLLSVISRLLPPDEGHVQIDGLDVGKTPSNQLARKISILKQTNHLQVRLTIRDLVEFGRFPYSKGRLNAEDKRFVEESIQYMELADMQHKYLDELSGGQQQRAFIAMVLAQDTEYVLLDEPLNNLDMKHSVQIMKVLRKLVDDLGKTVVLVLHDINFASSYSDHIIAMKDGRIAKKGTTDEMMDSAILKEIYEMDIPITVINGKKIGIYFS